MLHDLKYALRLLIARPAFSLAAIATLAIGIGGASAMFGVLDAVMLRPLPFRDPASLVIVWERNAGFTEGDVPASPGNFIAWQRIGAFERLAALTFNSYTLTVQGEPQRLAGTIVTPGFFDLLGVVPAAGRPFAPDDARAQQSAAMISLSLARQLGISGDPAGRTIPMNDRDVRVVGVLPASFAFPGVTADVWLLRGLPPGSEKNVGGHSLTVVGRLKPGRSIESAQAELDTFVRALNAGGPNAAWTAALVPIAREGLSAATLRALPILFGAVELLLVIACANVASLLLVRAVGRQREFAIRAAIGAGPGRLARLALVESVFVAALAGGAGLLLAGWLLVAVRTLGPADLVRLETASVDPRVMLFATLMSLATGGLVALAPVLRTRRPDLSLVLAAGARGASSDRSAARLRATIVAGEVAVALVLAVGATLLVRSYAAVRSVDPGIRVDRVLTMRVALPFARYGDAAARRAFFDDVLARVERVGGVTRAALTDNLPLSGNSVFYFIEVGGVAPPGPGEPLFQADTRTVSAAYFDALSLPVVRGRAFDERDTASSEPVAIVNERFARRYFGSADPIGGTVKRLVNGETPRRIVGVVKDVHHHGLDQKLSIEMYLLAAQVPPFGATLVVKTAGSSMESASLVKAQVHAVDPRLPITGVRTFDDLVARTLAGRKFQALMLGSFACAAVLLTVVGVYGVLAFAIGERTREIGVRVALGARPGDILRLVAGQGLAPVAAGVVVGGVAAWWLSRLLTSLLYQVSPGDWYSFGAATLLLLSSATAACAIPARNAARMDPVQALRANQ